MVSRRTFNAGLCSLAFAGLTGCGLGRSNAIERLLSDGYGELNPDPNNLLDLPNNFTYRIISSFGDSMSDNFSVPDAADGMGCIAIDDERVALIRNHELDIDELNKQPNSNKKIKSPFAYDVFKDSGLSLPGGTTTIIYNMKSQQKEREFFSLIGTVRNCAGGVTPWGSWLTCEESTLTTNDNVTKNHGYIFEVPAKANGLVKPEPLKAMGRFNHEAAAIDPNTGIVYLTEDRGDSLFYRFIPNKPGKLAKGGKLQALSVIATPKFDTRNWDDSTLKLQQPLAVQWIDLEDPESPNDDLRWQGHRKGAALFARGEGIHWDENELYFCCTNGGQKKLGQVMRYQPSPFEGTDKEKEHPASIALFFESEHESMYNFGDNLTVTPLGHLLVCEDQYTDEVNNYLRGITPEGRVYPFARLRAQTELAGACFSPDGSTLFVNVYSPSKTLAITGPWHHFIA